MGSAKFQQKVQSEMTNLCFIYGWPLARDVSSFVLISESSFRAKKKSPWWKLLEWIVVRPCCFFFFFFCGEGLLSSISADLSSMNQKLVTGQRDKKNSNSAERLTGDVNDSKCLLEFIPEGIKESF